MRFHAEQSALSLFSLAQVNHLASAGWVGGESDEVVQGHWTESLEGGDALVVLAGRNDLADLLDEVDDLVDLTGLAQKVVDLGGGLLAEVAGGVALQLGHGELVGAVAAKWGAKLALLKLRLNGLESVGQEHWGVGGAARGDALWKLWADVVDDKVSLRAPRRVGENAKSRQGWEVSRQYLWKVRASAHAIGGAGLGAATSAKTLAHHEYLPPSARSRSSRGTAQRSWRHSRRARKGRRFPGLASGTRGPRRC